MLLWTGSATVDKVRVNVDGFLVTVMVVDSANFVSEEIVEPPAVEISVVMVLITVKY